MEHDIIRKQTLHKHSHSDQFVRAVSTALIIRLFPHKLHFPILKTKTMCAPQTSDPLALSIHCKMNGGDHDHSRLTLSEHSYSSRVVSMGYDDDDDDDDDLCSEDEFSVNPDSIAEEERYSHFCEEETRRKNTLTQRLPFAVTATFLVAQFNMSIINLESQNMPVTATQWMAANCSIIMLLWAAKQYRNTMSQIHVTGAMALHLAEIVTGSTLLLLLLQLRLAALVVMVGGLLYMALATGIASVHLLTLGAHRGTSREKQPKRNSIPKFIIL